LCAFINIIIFTYLLQTVAVFECCLTKLLPYILFAKKCTNILALQMVSPRNRHCMCQLYRHTLVPHEDQYLRWFSLNLHDEDPTIRAIPAYSLNFQRQRFNVNLSQAYARFITVHIYYLRSVVETARRTDRRAALTLNDSGC